MDDRYFYLADQEADAVYVWAGIPSSDDAPLFTLSVDQPGRLSSDGEFLAVTTTFGHAILVYRVDDLPAGAPASVGGRGRLNLPESGAIAGGALFVADTGNSRVLVWHDVAAALEQAAAGRFEPDAVLGQPDRVERVARIGRDRMFWPGAVAYDGDYAWVGEFKFSGRLVRFSPTP